METEERERDHKIVSRMEQILTEVWGESNWEHVVCTVYIVHSKWFQEGQLMRDWSLGWLRATCALRLGNVRKGSFRRTPCYSVSDASQCHCEKLKVERTKEKKERAPRLGNVRKRSLVRKPSCLVAGASWCHWVKLNVARILSSSGGRKKGSGKPWFAIEGVHQDDHPNWLKGRG